MCSESPAEGPECPIALHPFEPEGPNRPYSLPCNHDVSRHALQQLLEWPGTKKECPICKQPLPSTNINHYKPNYGMVYMLQMLKQRAPETPKPLPPHPASHQQQHQTHARSSSMHTSPYPPSPYGAAPMSLPHTAMHASHASYSVMERAPAYHQLSLSMPHTSYSTFVYSLQAQHRAQEQYYAVPPELHASIPHAASSSSQPQYAVYTPDNGPPTAPPSISAYPPPPQSVPSHIQRSPSLHAHHAPSTHLSLYAPPSSVHVPRMHDEDTEPPLATGENHYNHAAPHSAPMHASAHTMQPLPRSASSHPQRLTARPLMTHYNSMSMPHHTFHGQPSDQVALYGTPSQAYRATNLIEQNVPEDSDGRRVDVVFPRGVGEANENRESAPAVARRMPAGFVKKILKALYPTRAEILGR